MLFIIVLYIIGTNPLQQFQGHDFIDSIMFIYYYGKNRSSKEYVMKLQ